MPASTLSLWDPAARDADLTLTLPGGLPMFFRYIPPDDFRMGSRGNSPDQEPIHRVVIPKGFYLGTFVVTQEQYRAVAEVCPALKNRADPSGFKGNRHPVDSVKWFHATQFCEWLTEHWNELEKHWKPAASPHTGEHPSRAGSADNLPAPLGDSPSGTSQTQGCRTDVVSPKTASLVPSGRLPDGTGESPVLPALPRDIEAVCLPTEAQWEYACRGRSETEYHNGDGDAALAQVGWVGDNSGGQTHSVDEMVDPTAPERHLWGLHGMHGNVWEWCQDVYDPNAYRKRLDRWIAKDWTMEDAGDDAVYFSDEDRKAGNAARVLRGGSWYDSAWDCRSAFRGRYGPDCAFRSFGFRVCLVPGPNSQSAETDSEVQAEPAPGDGGRGTRPESDGASGAAVNYDLASLSFSPRSGAEIF